MGNEVRHEILEVVKVDVSEVDLDGWWTMVDKDTVLGRNLCPQTTGVRFQGIPDRVRKTGLGGNATGSSVVRAAIRERKKLNKER